MQPAVSTLKPDIPFSFDLKKYDDNSKTKQMTSNCSYSGNNSGGKRA